MMCSTRFTRRPALWLIPPIGFATVLLACFAMHPASAGAQQVIVQKPGSMVAATPISIPRFARLKLYDPGHAVSDAPIPIPKPAWDTDGEIPPPPPSPGGDRGLDPGLGPLPPPPSSSSAEPKLQPKAQGSYGATVQSPGQAVGAATESDAVMACDLLRQRNNQLFVRLHYALAPDRPRPVYAGGWLFGENGKDVGVGYAPTTIPAEDLGTVDIVLTLPTDPFETAYLEAFLMESGKVIALQRFAARYQWNAPQTGQPDTLQGDQVSLGLTSYEQLQGAWVANIMGVPVEYVFTADGDSMNDPQAFQWRVDAIQQVAKGRIQPDNRITARWQEPGGAVTDSASVTLDGQGNAVRMVWTNGVIMERNAN